MKTQYAVALALLTGVGLGAAAVQGLHAQAKPPAYVIAEIDVANQEGYAKEYLPAGSKAMLDGGAKYLARGTRTAAFKGEPPKPSAIRRRVMPRPPAFPLSSSMVLGTLLRPVW
jgi:hypothetical protein